MINHVMIGTNNIDGAKCFYDAVLAVLGARGAMRNVTDTGHVRLFYMHNGSAFVITQPIDGQPATVANGSTLGFKCSSPEQVKQFHDVAVANGGTSLEDPPGLRNVVGLGPMHLAYVRDLDGNKLCAIYRPG